MNELSITTLIISGTNNISIICYFRFYSTKTLSAFNVDCNTKKNTALSYFISAELNRLDQKTKNTLM